MRQDYFKQELEELSALGYKEYEYMASHADDTCEICKSLNGKHFPITEAVIGVNCPPMHKGCRCLIGGSSENYEEIISDIGKWMRGGSVKWIEEKIEKKSPENESLKLCPFCCTKLDVPIVKFCPYCGKEIM